MSTIQAPKEYDPREAAAAVLQAVLNRDATKALAQMEVASDDLWAYGCNLNPHHVGIIFFQEPSALVPLHGGQWTAVWRPEGGGSGFWGEGSDLICQQCWIEREERVTLRLRVEQSRDRRTGMTITMEPEWKRRFCHKMSRSALAKFLPAPEEPKAPTKTEDPNAARRTQPQPAATRTEARAAGSAPSAA